MSTRLGRTRLFLGACIAAAIGAPHTVLAAEDEQPVLVAAKKTDDTAALASRAIARPELPPLELLPRPAVPARPGPLRPGGLAVPIAETLATHLVMMEWSRSVGGAPWADVTFDSAGRNLRHAWVLDNDDFWVNQFGHPYQGTFPFTAARSSGLGFWASAPFPIIASALWEVAGETTLPSVNDQVTTTVSGLVLGEILYRFAGALRHEGGPWNEVLASLLAPMGALNRQLLGTSQAMAAPPSRWQLALGGAAFTGPGPSGGRAPLPYGDLSFTYGLPGSEGLELERPFDHFVIDLGSTASADPAVTAHARGLLAGAAFGSDPSGGLYGGFLSFDFDSTPGHRVSTSAIGFGASARTDLAGGVALEGDAIASAVFLGAGGIVDRLPNSAAGEYGVGRNYRFGPGQQALLGVRILAGSRVSAGLSLRQYLLLPLDGPSGSELLLHGTASATVRIVGAAGLGVELGRYVRRADVGPDTIRQADSALRIYVAWLGGA